SSPRSAASPWANSQHRHSCVKTSGHTGWFVDSENAPYHCSSCHTSRPLHFDNADISRLLLPWPVPPSGTMVTVFRYVNKWETRPKKEARCPGCPPRLRPDVGRGGLR